MNNMKNNYMYHYTSLKSFLKIWVDKKLKFSPISDVNDINEVSKFYFGKDIIEIKKEVESYNQISLVKEVREEYVSCMSPVMWGQYGDKGRGICIRINISEIKLSNKMFKGKVKYVKKITPIPYDYDNSNISKFIAKHKTSLFFTKTKDWSHENEYRIVSKEEEFLDISKAISEIIITSIFDFDKNDENSGGFRSGLFSQVLKSIIPSKIKILEFCPKRTHAMEVDILIDEEGNQIYPLNQYISVDLGDEDIFNLDKTNKRDNEINEK